MPKIIAVIDTGEPIFPGLTKKEHIEVQKLSVEEFLKLKENITDLLRRVHEKAKKKGILKGGRLIGYYIRAKAKNKRGLDAFFRPGVDF